MWAEEKGLNKHISNYVLNYLVIFYFQYKVMLPSVFTLQYSITEQNLDRKLILRWFKFHLSFYFNIYI